MHERLQTDNTKIYFVELETDDEIKDEFTLNYLVMKKLKVDISAKVKLLIKIQGLFGPL